MGKQRNLIIFFTFIGNGRRQQFWRLCRNIALKTGFYENPAIDSPVQWSYHAALSEELARQGGSFGMGIADSTRRLMKRAGQAMSKKKPGDGAVISFSVKSRRKLGWAFFVGMQGR